MRMTTTGQAITAAAVGTPRFAQATRGAVARARQDDVSRVRFLNWLQVNEPEVFSLLRAGRPELVNPGYSVSGLGEDAPSSDLATMANNAIDFLKQSIPAYFQYRTQESCIELNLQRMARGEAPVDCSAVTPGVNVGVAPETRTLLYLAVGALALVGVAFAFKKR